MKFLTSQEKLADYCHIHLTQTNTTNIQRMVTMALCISLYTFNCAPSKFTTTLQIGINCKQYSYFIDKETKAGGSSITSPSSTANIRQTQDPKQNLNLQILNSSSQLPSSKQVQHHTVYNLRRPLHSVQEQNCMPTMGVKVKVRVGFILS